ncbi:MULTISPECIES: GTP-binding protein [Mesorhizobium]|uniref:GTP-binding protein n=1 Tax=Mesorhizobium denitrificans TaxID=2294114 RepID=A0A371XGY9_9HYPH|nr:MULTISPECIES: GTP-binding protein [Mesorhizobium]RFC68499.1 GTP-binding protein [Mesorhizobium denitrificans]
MEDHRADGLLPVTVLAGFLGSGKTTLLNHVLRNAGEHRIAVIVNDMSEVNIDADLIRDADVTRTDETMVELSNGCICCTLREDLLVEVRRLAEAGKFDYILIEGTGIAEPLPIAASFSFKDEEGRSLRDISRLDTMVSVVDAANLLKDFSSQDLLSDRGEVRDDEDQRSLIDLLVDQIEFADVVVINKASEVSADELAEIRKTIKSLNIDAKLIETDFGKVELSEILDTKLYSEAKAATHPLWHKELYSPAEHIPETEEYGIASFVYRARRPFDPEKFYAFTQRKWDGLLRAKGHFWLATRKDWIGLYSVAGTQTKVDQRGFWWASVPRTYWPRQQQFQAMLQRYWTATWGDRRQELVFIGVNLPKEEISAALDACLSGSETGIDAREVAEMRDPFPEWVRHDHAAA